MIRAHTSAANTIRTSGKYFLTISISFSQKPGPAALQADIAFESGITET